MTWIFMQKHRITVLAWEVVMVVEAHWGDGGNNATHRATRRGGLKKMFIHTGATPQLKKVDATLKLRNIFVSMNMMEQYYTRRKCSTFHFSKRRVSR